MNKITFSRDALQSGTCFTTTLTVLIFEPVLQSRKKVERKQIIVRPANTDMVYAARALALVRNVCILEVFVNLKVFLCYIFHFVFNALQIFWNKNTAEICVSSEISKQRHLRQGIFYTFEKVSRYIIGISLHNFIRPFIGQQNYLMKTTHYFSTISQSVFLQYD